MPELPEVETVVRGLRRVITGRRIISVILRKTDFIDDPAALELNLPGKLIESVNRYGKFMLLKLTGGDEESGSLLVHLGMTGQIASLPATKPWEKHTHTSFLLDDGRELRYTDPRRFGRMAYLSGEGLKTHLAGFGTDPLEIGAEDFTKKIRAHAARIKALLLNQSVLRGVGNIYSDESLWRAKIHPARLGSSLSKKQSLTLRRALQQILHRAILMRGSSISDYLDADGEPGDYQRRHQAYGREGQPCSRCRSKIRRSIVAGRSSFFCPKCQPAPRGRRRLPRTGKNDVEVTQVR